MHPTIENEMKDERQGVCGTKRALAQRHKFKRTAHNPKQCCAHVGRTVEYVPCLRPADDEVHVPAEQLPWHEYIGRDEGDGFCYFFILDQAGQVTAYCGQPRSAECHAEPPRCRHCEGRGKVRFMGDLYAECKYCNGTGAATETTTPPVPVESQPTKTFALDGDGYWEDGRRNVAAAIAEKLKPYFTNDMG